MNVNNKNNFYVFLGLTLHLFVCKRVIHLELYLNLVGIEFFYVPFRARTKVRLARKSKRLL